jgi:5-(carboxyamino)imidazole ribonucleotide synthase
MSKPILGIIGGGQLGSLLAAAAKKINIKTVIFCDDYDAPGQKFSDQFIYGKYDDQNAINQFVNTVDIITFEFENIPFQTLKKINSVKPVIPNPSINKTVQDRLTEKDFLNKLNIRTTQYISVNNLKDIFSNENLIPGLLKTRTLGYDGKGQYKINSIEDFKDENINFNKGYILEKLVKLKKEISVIITRFKDEKYEIYEPFENTHEDQILKHSKIPAGINRKILEQSKKWTHAIAEELNYIGTLCVEFFIDKNDNLYVNEIAPRVHNSGHLTINAYNISQFENHIRAVCNLDRVKLNKISNAEMINLIGDQISIYRKKKYASNEFFFDYLKKETKYKRKMGHLTTLIK